MKFRAFLDSKVLDIKDAKPASKADVEIAEAAVSGNSTLTWMKFILTDSEPNGNYQRIPKSEFASILSSGINMPLKMASGRVNEGHDDALPLGVITNLVEEDNKIVALAAMWGEERPSDISLLKDKMFSTGVMVSWELLYSMSSYDDGIENLHDITLKAATIVGRPAYEGRTPVLAISSKKKSRKKVWSKKYIDSLPDSAFLITGIRGKGSEEFRLYPFMDAKGHINEAMLDKSMKELSESNLPMGVIRGAVSKARRIQETINDASASIVDKDLEDITLKTVEELTKEVEDLNAKVSGLEKELKDKDATASDGLAEIESMKEELEALRAFKSDIDAVAERKEKMASIIEKFSEAGIEKDEDYFESNSELLLGLDESALGFMVQEMAAFASKKVEDKEVSASKIPNVVDSSDSKKTDIGSLAEALRNDK